jgi:hypothetical protein
MPPIGLQIPSKLLKGTLKIIPVALKYLIFAMQIVPACGTPRGSDFLYIYLFLLF